MVTQYVRHSCQMKEQIIWISISFYLEKIEKVFVVQHHFL